MAGRRRRAEAHDPVSRSPEAAPIAVWDRLAGRRLLRTIGSGEHSTVYVASADGQVVVKAYNGDVHRESIVNEVSCLAAIASPHVVAMLDLSLAPGQPPCLVLERLSDITLAEWLRASEVLEPGEMVTAAVSVVRAVGAVHAAGWTHNDISASNIRFDASGCPVLLGFSRARRETAERIAGDWDRCSAIVTAIIERVEPIHTAAIERAVASLTRLRGAGHEGTTVEEVEAALFAIGPPAPLQTRAAASGAQRTAPPTRRTAIGRVLGREPSAVPRFGRSTGAVRGTDSGPMDSVGPSERGRTRLPQRTGLVRAVTALGAVMERGVTSTARDWLHRVTAGRRRPVIVAVAVAIVVTVGAVLLLPGAHSVRAETPEPTTVASSAPATPSAASSESANEGSPRSTPEATPPSEEDPVQAAHRLLGIRHDCIERGEAECLTEADQADGPLLAADRALIAAHSPGSATPALSQLSIAETVGDAVVISVAPAGETTKPASVLVIRTDAGWRLRALFEN